MGSLLSLLPPFLFHTSVAFLLRQLFHRVPPLSSKLASHFNSPTPIPKTILLTGFTAGLGYSAAVLLLRLNVQHIVLVGRNEKRSLAGLEELKNDPALQGLFGGDIEERLKVEAVDGGWGYVGKRVSVLWCDQGRVGDVVEFSERFRKWGQWRSGMDGIDAVILNAGVVPKGWDVTEDGWEESLQVRLEGLMFSLEGY